MKLLQQLTVMARGQGVRFLFPSSTEKVTFMLNSLQSGFCAVLAFGLVKITLPSGYDVGCFRTAAFQNSFPKPGQNSQEKQQVSPLWFLSLLWDVFWIEILSIIFIPEKLVDDMPTGENSAFFELFVSNGLFITDSVFIAFKHLLNSSVFKWFMAEVKSYVLLAPYVLVSSYVVVAGTGTYLPGEIQIPWANHIQTSLANPMRNVGFFSAYRFTFTVELSEVQ